MSSIAAQAVTAVERFGFTLFFATAIHAVAIIGISFTSETQRPPQKTLEITLAQRSQETAPKEADFIAQANQLGSGQADEKKLPSTPQKANIQDTKVNKLAPQRVVAAQTTSPQPVPDKKQPPAEKPRTAPKQSSAQQKKVVTTTKSNQATAQQTSKSKSPQSSSPPVGGSTSLLARSLQIASLQAELDSHREMMAKKPRVRRLTSASTQKREDALYLDNWRRKIESVGNLNYPEEARRQKMYGSLRLLVAIKPDGSVKSIEILESSGQPVLDDAAKSIVRLAAPFQPFPVEMRKNTDILEIIRTWKFEKKAFVY